MITVRSKDKVSPKNVLLIFVLRLDLGTIYHFVHTSGFLFIWKIEKHKKLHSHILPSLLWKKFPSFTVCSRAGKSPLWADASWLPIFVHVTHELKMITTCLSGQEKTDRRLLKVHATWTFCEVGMWVSEIWLGHSQACSRLHGYYCTTAGKELLQTLLSHTLQNICPLSPSQKVCLPLPYRITIANILVCFLLGWVFVCFRQTNI